MRIEYWLLIILIVIVLVVYFLMNKKTVKPTGCRSNSECYNGGICDVSSGTCTCNGNFDPLMLCLTCKTGYGPDDDCSKLIVKFYSLPNYGGTEFVKYIDPSATETIFSMANNCTSTDQKIGFVPRSVKMPSGYVYCIRGNFSNPGDTQCGPSGYCYTQNGDVNLPKDFTKNCFADIYSGGPVCATTWSLQNVNGTVAIKKLFS
jgi:hypothetical protein